MYRYRQCMPRANKHLDDKWVKQRQQSHRRRLQEIRWVGQPSQCHPVLDALALREAGRRRVESTV